jgi:membrane protease YdiL (CAAX protease family)
VIDAENGDPHVGATTSTDRSLLLALTLAPYLPFLFHSKYFWFGLIPQALVLWHFWRRNFVLWARAVYWPMFYTGILLFRWPLKLLVPLVIYLVIYASWTRFRLATHWLVAGRFTVITVAWMVPTAIVSSGALLAWVFLLHPNLADLSVMMPTGGILALIGIGAAFSLLNAAWEEFVFKGIAWNTLDGVFQRSWVTNCIQSSMFGLVHLGGFPRGWLGVAMATVYGFALGVIGKESNGLLAPIVTHVFADATIFLILYFISVGMLA